jgi:hypothetical protein
MYLNSWGLESFSFFLLIYFVYTYKEIAIGNSFKPNGEVALNDSWNDFKVFTLGELTYDF